MAAPGDLFNRVTLRQLAGDKTFRRGEQVFADGRVEQLRLGTDRAAARVQGASRAYRVKLWRSRGELHFSCDCPAGRDHALCKHGVAVGLAWLHGREHPDDPAGASTEEGSEAGENEFFAPAEEGPNDKTEPAIAPAELRAYLNSLDKKRLLHLALEAIDYDEILRRRLMLETIGAPQGRPLGAAELAVYRRLLREAIEVSDYVDYDAMPDYVQGIEEALRPLDALLESGQAAAVVELCEIALVELENASGATDAADGSLNAIYDNLQRLHHAACLDAKPEPAALAERLLEYELEGGLGIFNNAAATYADVLGPRGLAAYAQLLQERWNQLPPLRPAHGWTPADERAVRTSLPSASPAPKATSPNADEDSPLDYRRTQLTALVEHFAQNAGAHAATRAAIRARDLSSSQDFVAIVHLLREAARPESALEWTGMALRCFPESAGATGLRAERIQLLLQLGRGAEAADLIWEEFVARPDAATFLRLKQHVSSETWTGWRKRAISHVRETLESATTERDGSVLVEILLTDGDSAGALAAARLRGCRIDLWLEIAADLENRLPAEALEILRRQLDAIIARGDSRSYQQAASLLRKIRHLYHRLNRDAEFGAFRDTVRATHRHRRSWVKLLDALERA